MIRWGATVRVLGENGIWLVQGFDHDVMAVVFGGEPQERLALPERAFIDVIERHGRLGA